jgi:capsular polysaccharide biosynthesis protein
MSRVTSAAGVAKFHFGQALEKSKRKFYRSLPHHLSDSILHGLERDGATEAVNLRIPSWRVDEIASGWTEVAPGVSLTVPRAGELEEEFHSWNAIRAWQLANARLDVDSGLIIARDRVVSATGNGFRSARDAAFISGAFRRVQSITHTQRNDAVAPLGDTWHHYHFLLETLPRILAIASVEPSVTFVGSGQMSNLARSILENLDISFEHCEQGQVLAGDSIYLCESSPQFWPHPTEIDRVRNALLETYGEAQSRKVERFYLTRSHAARSIQGEPKLESALEGEGFRILRMEQLAFHEQVKLMQKAALIVAPHGAGLANILFLRDGSKVVEVSSGDSFESCYRRIAASLDFEYRYVKLPSSPSVPFGSGEDALEEILLACNS